MYQVDVGHLGPVLIGSYGKVLRQAYCPLRLGSLYVDKHTTHAKAKLRWACYPSHRNITIHNTKVDLAPSGIVQN